MRVFYDTRMLDYHAPEGMFDSYPSPLLEMQMPQPEGPERILNTISVLKRGPLAKYLSWVEPDPATDEEILTFHRPVLLNQLKQAESMGEYVSTSTYMPKDGMPILRIAAGAALSAVRYVLEKDGNIGYAICRPPNHHASPMFSDGYCFLNGIGMAALEALKLGVQRIAVIDWDVHHGNGTQTGFYDRDDVLTISMHMDHGSWGPHHPETGGMEETGAGAGEGYNINLPLPLGSGDATYVSVFEQCVIPKVLEFQPDLIILANGQDANQFDPNGRQSITMAGYHQLATLLLSLARQTCSGRLMMTQEGGYNPTYAPLCAYAVAAGLLDQPLEIDDPISLYPDDEDRATRDVTALIDQHPLFQ